MKLSVSSFLFSCTGGLLFENSRSFLTCSGESACCVNSMPRVFAFFSDFNRSTSQANPIIKRQRGWSKSWN